MITQKKLLLIGTAYPSRAHEFTLIFLWGSCCSIFSFKCRNLQIIVCFFLAHLAFRPCELLPSLFVRRSSSSINISHFNLLLRNHWANCNQILVEQSLDGPLPKLCPVIPTSNQDGRQAKNRKRGDEIKKSSPLKLLSQSQPNFAEMILGWFPSKFLSDISDLRPRWPPQPNLI